MSDLETGNPWDWITENPGAALREIGVLSSAQDEAGEMWVHVVAEDPRYPMMCVNGGMNFGVEIDGVTGKLVGGRRCICAAGVEDLCICDVK